MAEQESLPHSVQRYVMVLRRQWWVALVVTIVALAAAVLYVERATPVYSASMKIVVGQGETLFSPNLAVNVQSYTQTITDLLESQVVARQTIQQLGLNENPTTLLGELGVSAGPNTSVIDVTYDDTNQARAVHILSTLGGIFTGLVNTALADKAKSGTSSQPVSVVVFDPAHADPGRVSPRTTRTLAIALVLGLVAGLLLALLRDALSGRIRNEEEAESAYGAHVIGALPKGTLGLPTHGATGLPPKLAARMGDTFQMLAARLRYSSDLERGVILVTGARPEDGKSTVSAHIAAVLAAAGNEVIAVEADLHRPALGRLLGVRAGHQGVREAITQGIDLDRLLVEVRPEQLLPAPKSVPVQEAEPVTVRTAATGPDARRSRRPEPKPGHGPAPRGRLRMLPAGVGGESPMNILSLGNSSPLVSRLRDECDYVVIDTPPLLLSGDAYPLVQLADAVLVVSKERASTVEDARRMRKILRSLGVHDFSLVVSESASVSGEDYYAYSDAR